VLASKVLVGKLLAVDRFTTGSVAAGEVTTLKHELRNDAVEGRASVSKALLAGAESTEVLSSLRDDVVKEVEVDAARLIANLASGLAAGIQEWALPGHIEKGLDGHVCG